VVRAAWLAIAIGCPWTAVSGRAQSPTAWSSQQLEFFEERIRPVLVEQCYACHNSSTQADGNLELDHREGLLRGGEQGKLFIPGEPRGSRLLAILRHEIPETRMPEGGAPLEPHILADFEKWIAMGAPDPRDQPPTAAELQQATSWEAILDSRRRWWSLQPIQEVAPPTVADNTWSQHPVDLFLLAKLREQRLEPGAAADAETLVRRLFFALLGLPPKAVEVEQWKARIDHQGSVAIEALVDQLLGSPHFGERWARHWMDWIRYADSHGSEGDPPLENGWLYRDYLIRALNADIPYDQLLREHIAGDLLPQPRIDHQSGIQESILGTAHWRMVFHGFAPTDALEEKVRFIDDQVNTFSKAFLGLTVSCARCHDHKFDAISQQDYYALFGVFSACRPGRLTIDLPELLDEPRERLAELKAEMKSGLARAWLESLDALPAALLADEGPWTKAKTDDQLLYPWKQFRLDLSQGLDIAEAWTRRLQGRREEAASLQPDRLDLKRWRLNAVEDFAAWQRTGHGLTEATPALAGEFAVAVEGNQLLAGIYPAGVYSHRLSDKQAARLSSRDLQLDGEYELWFQARGDGGSLARFVVQDYPRKGTVFPVVELKDQWSWHKLDMSYWDGDEVYVEFSTAMDAPLLVKDQPRSWFGVRDVLIRRQGQPSPATTGEFLEPWWEVAAASATPSSLPAAAATWTTALRLAIQAWIENTLSDSQALFLDASLQAGLLPNTLEEVPAIAEILREYRRLEGEWRVPTRAPSLEETQGRTQRLYVRGDHKQPGEIVPRGFLQVLNAQPYASPGSGRLALAEDMLRPDNPLTRRVIVNRLWHHLFGRGIVPTPDNFGRLGQLPTHPELLDYLAGRFRNQGGSLKEMIRLLVTSKAWQTRSTPSVAAENLDPDNRWLSHMSVRRLEAESIRDTLLAVTGRLDRQMFGAPVDGKSQRRSVYLRVKRNDLDPFLRAFDFPEPFTAVGRRDVTNVPAQSLTMLNDPFVASLAEHWARQLLQSYPVDERARLQALFLSSFSRPATSLEMDSSWQYLRTSLAEQRAVQAKILELQRKIDARRAAIDERLSAWRLHNKAEARAAAAVDTALLEPIARWEFKTHAKDLLGTMHAELLAGARLEGGALIVDGKSYALTAPLPRALRAKTLEAWVQLDTLEQQGGGVMTIQSRDGRYFDAIVFGEKTPQRWLAGSDHHARTQAWNGKVEGDASQRAVHLVAVYREDGTIIGYRDGQIYGEAYRSDGPHEFPAGQTVVGFGLRHSPAGGNRMLRGQILHAQLYDQALTAQQVLASYQRTVGEVSETSWLASISPELRDTLATERQELVGWEAELAALQADFGLSPALASWTELARALFTVKEFIFIK
jgi:hypothetical protein